MCEGEYTSRVGGGKSARARAKGAGGARGVWVSAGRCEAQDGERSFFHGGDTPARKTENKTCHARNGPRDEEAAPCVSCESNPPSRLKLKLKRKKKKGEPKVTARIGVREGSALGPDVLLVRRKRAVQHPPVAVCFSSGTRAA